MQKKLFCITPLAAVIGACFLSACSTKPTVSNHSTAMVAPQQTPVVLAPIAPTPTTPPLGYVANTPSYPAPNNASTNGLDAETLAIFDDLLEARDMSMVEGGKIEVQQYGDLWDRVRRGYKMQQPFNPRIDVQKGWFSSRQSYIERLTARASRYLYHTVSEAERRGIPTELALLPIIESSYDPAATSNASAAGLWQFIPSTGRIYGLNQGVNYDGRRDVIESTRAAYDFLTTLYNQFGSWELALAAYNAGPGRIQRAIDANAAQGLPTDYWSLRLPTETMNYVPRFMAVAQVIANPANYGLSLPAIANHAHFRTAPVNYGVSLYEVANVTGVPVEELQLLNPALVQMRVDAAGSGRVVIPNRLPAQTDKALAALTGLGYGAQTQQNQSYIAPNSIASINPAVSSELAQTNTLPTTAAALTVNKTIIQEPPLSKEERDFIAQQINQSGAKTVVAKDGNIELEAIQTAQSVLEARGQKKSLRYGDKASEKPANYAPSPVLPVNTNKTKTVHAVKAGDTLIGIANQYGVTVSDLRAWNNLGSNDVLKSGTNLVLVATKSVRTNQSTKSVANEPQSHTVKSKETLSSIAQKYNLSLDELALYNNLTTTTRVRTGQKLWLVPNKTQKTSSYRVQAGDTLTGVAARYNVDIEDLAAANKLSVKDGLIKGKMLVIPSKATSGKTTSSQNSKSSTQSNIDTEDYKVKAGDSLTAVAQNYGITVAELAKVNNLSHKAKLDRGDTIKVPKLTKDYKVKSGDTLIGLAARFGVSTSELAKMNGLSSKAILKRGQVLTVPNQ